MAAAAPLRPLTLPPEHRPSCASALLQLVLHSTFCFQAGEEVLASVLQTHGGAATVVERACTAFGALAPSEAGVWPPQVHPRFQKVAPRFVRVLFVV